MMQRVFLLLPVFYLVFLTPTFSQPLNGSYTIGGNNPDFPGLQEAMDTASARGVSGPVEFVLRPGTYTGLYNFYGIPGTGPNRKLILRSENNDSSSVNITGFTNSNQTVMMRLYQLEYVEFHHLGFSLLNSPNNAFTIGIIRGKYLGFYNCNIKGYPSSSALPDKLISGAPDTGYVVKKCYFAFGGGGLFVSNTAFSFRNALIENNVFDYVGSESIYVNGGAFTQIKNNIINVGGGGTATGILMSGSSRYEISGNRIYLIAGTLNSAVLQLISSSGWPSQKSRIFNNVFFINSGTNFVAYNFRSSSSYNLEIAHNTFYMNGGSSAHVFYMVGSFGTNDQIDIHNNIFYRHDTISSNHIFRIPNLVTYLPYVSSDYNVFYSQAPDFNAEYSTFSDYQTTGADSHSVYANPLFLADSLLKFQNPLIENMGTPVPWVGNDIEGNFRNTLNPDPGAFETPSAPVANLGQDTIVCNPIFLFANANGASVVWNDGSGADSLLADSTGWYSLTLSNALGISTDSVFITVLEPDAVSLSVSSSQVCLGTVVNLSLNAAGNGSFQWTDTLLTSLTRTVVVSSDTVFSGIWTALNGCITTASAVVNIFEAPEVTLVLADTFLCSSVGNYLLSGGLPAGGIYTGSNVNGSQLDLSGFQGSWASVNYQFTDSNSCVYSATDSVFVDVCSFMSEYRSLPDFCPETALRLWLSENPEARIVSLFTISGQQSAYFSGRFLFSASLSRGLYIVAIEYRGRTFFTKMPIY
jgi:hypothetical protein